MTTLDKRLQVFISSTYLDLKVERQAAVEAILSARHMPAGMELFAAGDQSQLAVIRQWIEQSDVFMLILGGRYGSIEPTSQKSYVQLEYEHAVEVGMPLFSVVITDKGLEKKVKRFGAEMIEMNSQRQLKEFRSSVLARMVEFCEDSRDLKIAVFKALQSFAEQKHLQKKLVGWVRANEAKKLKTKINALEKEREKILAWQSSHVASRVSLEEEIGTLRRKVRDMEMEMGRVSERAQEPVLDAPFTLTLSVDPHFLLADGLYTQLIDLGRDFSRTLLKIRALIRTEGQKEILDIVADDLQEALHQSEWAPVWNDYVEKARAQGREPRFVLRVADSELFQFPIEILAFNGLPLGLETPVYKELMIGQRDSVYRLARNRLPLERELNVLLVGSSRGGDYDHRHYPDLTLVDQEVSDICHALLASGPDQRLKIGKIVALVDAQEKLPKGVQKYAPSTANLARALRGELGFHFHLFHYCGHYIADRHELAGGFLLYDGQNLRLFNLAEWRNVLSQTTLRLVCLNACANAAYVQDSNLYHLGAALTAVAAGTPATIGMRWSIKDVQRYDFSRTFYPQLVQSGIPELALFEARRKLHEMNSGSTFWAVPDMLTR